MRTNRILAVLRVLVLYRGFAHKATGHVGLTRGELRILAGLHPDTELLRPVRDLRKPQYGLTIDCKEYNEGGERVWRYHLPDDQLPAARKILERAKKGDPNAND